MYDTYPDKETETVLMNSFQWDSTEVIVKFAHCQKQNGGADCGLLSIVFATAIPFGKQPGKLKSHFVTCLNKGEISINKHYVSCVYHIQSLIFTIHID